MIPIKYYKKKLKLFESTTYCPDLKFYMNIKGRSRQQKNEYNILATGSGLRLWEEKV